MLHVATNQYPWGTFYQRQGRDFGASMDDGLAEVAASGLDGFEPFAGEPDDIDRLASLTARHGLGMRSIYVGSNLHDPAEADGNVRRILAVGERARAVGTRIVVTNPNPIGWGSAEAKTDAQLRIQARALTALGRGLAEMGLVLAYHNHDVELRHAAREFHHMMLATDPQAVRLCLDAHWIYRGSGNSTVAVADVVKLYGHRVAELHLRQSAGGVWTEVFGEGDIDYPALAAALAAVNVRPHLVVEQAVEDASPNTMDALSAHRPSCANTRRIFAAFGE